MAALSENGRSRADRPAAGWTWKAGVFAAVLIVAGLYVPDRALASVVLTAAVTFAIVGLLFVLRVNGRNGAARSAVDSVSAFVGNDVSPGFVTDDDGVVIYRNSAAEERFGNESSGGPLTLARMLRDLFANPVSLLTRLQARAEARGAAREDLVTRKGHVRLAVHCIGEGRFLWRLDDLVERGSASRGAEALSLPMLTASRTGTVLFMNDALRRILGGRVKTLDRIFRDLPLRPDGEHQIMGVDGPVRARVVEIEGTGGRREIFLVPANAMSARPVSGEATALLDDLPVALVKMTRTGEVRTLNRQARTLLGDEARPGMLLSALVEGLGRSVRDWLEDAAEGRGLGQSEVLRASLQEEETFLQIALGRVIEGSEVLILAVLNDATELKTLEAQFVQSQKMQAIGQLAGGVAHDFNNLLTAISGHCDLLLLRHDQGDLDYGDLMQINQNANRAASLVGQLLAFSRKQTLQPEVLDLSETLGDLTHLLNRLVGERITLTLSHDPAVRPIRADKRQLEQVVMNLVVNARDAMPDGGEIRIETEARTLAEPFRRDRATVPAGDYMIVRVTDSGIGIVPDKLQKVFEPFYSTKRLGEGTGLGLSTAYGIVKQTGGFIFADSVPGSGSTFTLFLPVYQGPAPEPRPASEIAPIVQMPAGEGVILLVEDEAPVRAFASRALRLRGYTVIEAESAEEALETLADESLKVDVFVTDVVMPGKDGPTWVREALVARPQARVVFVSGYAEDHFSDAQARIPNSVFLPKPFSLTDLTATVHNQLH